MENPGRKLTLSQETLRNLTQEDPGSLREAGTHTCEPEACPSHHHPHCMPVAIDNR